MKSGDARVALIGFPSVGKVRVCVCVCVCVCVRACMSLCGPIVSFPPSLSPDSLLY